MRGHDSFAACRFFRSLGLAYAALTLAGCGDDSTSNPGGESPARLTVPLEGAVSGVPLQAGQTTHYVTELHVPSDIRSVQAAELDVQATMLGVTLEGIPASSLARALLARLGGAPLNAVTYLRVGTDSATVCSDGISYGPFTAAYTSSLTVDPPTATMDEATLQIVNAGSFFICLSITPDFDATMSLDDLEADVTQEDCAAPADFSGRWVGTYQCGNSCNGFPFGGDIELIVTQDGTSASYTDDGGDMYTGTVCGDVFRFRRVGPVDDDEVGSLTLEGVNQATKHSTWRTTAEPHCGGNCVDQLTRVTP